MRLARWLAAVLALNAVWYGWYVAFPLFGEDGAANYSSLVETVRSAPLFTSRFPVKWLEGLGQPNVFVTVTFDPFSWLMRLPLDPAAVLRLSYVLRATLCWLTTYLWVRALLRGARGVATTAGFLGVLVSFMLTHPRGVPVHGAMFNATQAALFPGLLWLYHRMAARGLRLGGPEVAFAGGLALFLLTYPVGSVLALPVLAAYGFAILATSGPRLRPAAAWALGKLGVAVSAALFAPGIGLYHAWAAVAAVSARQVFAAELTTYGRGYLPPLFWSDVPLPLRAVVLMGAALVLLARWSRPLKAVVVTLGLVVGATQIATAARAAGMAAEGLEQLPRPFYVEFSLPPLYAAAAAYALAKLPHLTAPPAWARPSWALRVVVLAQAAFGLVGLHLALATAVPVALCGWLNQRTLSPVWRPRFRGLARAVPGLAVALLFVGAALTLRLWPDSVHPLFAAGLLCRDRGLWCREPGGPSMGAGTSPLADFLRARLADGDGAFRGRAEFLLTPAPRLVTLPISHGASFSPQDLQRLRDWYARARAQERTWFPPSAFPSRVTPFRLTGEASGWQARELLEALTALAKNGDPVDGILPDDVLAELVEWAGRSPTTVPVPFTQPWRQLAEVTIMVEDRNRNFLATGNGMLLRALPLQQVPVASSYEQSLDYLYYLFWTRYVNEAATANRSINFTALETLAPERLRLIGVRYVVARDVPFQAPPALPRVLGWRGYSVYELDGANTAGYGPKRPVFADSLAGELAAMQAPGFDPRVAAVLPGAARSSLGGAALAPVVASRLAIAGQSLVFEGTAPGRALAVLPFRFSHCWRADWSEGAGRVVRADLALLGIVFDGGTRVRLTWTAGYGSSARCLREDAVLAHEARDAARAR